jgi:hypothetical protein
MPDGELVTDLKLRLFQRSISDLFPEVPKGLEVSETDVNHRQALLTGGRGEAAIRRTTLAVVGLSGGGSHIVQQAAHIGFGHIIGIDDDHAESSNRGRVIGMTRWDTILRKKKVAIMRRLVKRINPRVNFTGVAVAVPRQAAINALKQADVIVGCVDSYHARSDIQEIASRYSIPYVDVGLIIRPVPETDEIVIGGNVTVAVPGRFCLWCSNFLTQARLDAETGGRPRSYFQGTEKQAQVVSMNGVLASQAMTDVLQLVTGFSALPEDLSYRVYDGGRLQDLVFRRQECDHCRTVVCAGEPIWNVA